MSGAVGMWVEQGCEWSMDVSGALCEWSHNWFLIDTLNFIHRSNVKFIDKLNFALKLNIKWSTNVLSKITINFYVDTIKHLTKNIFM